MTRMPDDDFLADQYVLNLLDPVEHEQTAQRIAGDSDFARTVAEVARRFHPLDDTVRPMPFPPGAWDRMDARLGVAIQPVASVTGADGPAAKRGASHRRLGLALAALILLTAGLTWAVLQKLPIGRHPDALAMAVLLDAGGAPFAVVQDFGGGAAAMIALARYQVPPDQSLQAWTKWSETVGPVSLGVLDRFTSVHLQTDGLPHPIADQLFEITLEPRGGSVTGRPSGPVLGAGRASLPG